MTVSEALGRVHKKSQTKIIIKTSPFRVGQRNIKIKCVSPRRQPRRTSIDVVQNFEDPINITTERLWKTFHRNKCFGSTIHPRRGFGFYTKKCAEGQYPQHNK